MPYRICRIFEIENGHMLSKHPDKCRFPHGHSRRVECVLEAPDLDDREMVCETRRHLIVGVVNGEKSIAGILPVARSGASEPEPAAPAYRSPPTTPATADSTRPPRAL